MAQDGGFSRREQGFESPWGRCFSLMNSELVTLSTTRSPLDFSEHTPRNWEQGRRVPEGPSLGLLRIAARHPSVLKENLRAVA
jgi:hypothetical protein